MVRTLVAVGTLKLASMFDAKDLAMPLRVATTLASGEGAVAATSPAEAGGAVVGASAGMGWGFASTEVVRATGVVPVVAAGSAVAVGAAVDAAAGSVGGGVGAVGADGAEFAAFSAGAWR